MNNFNLFKLVLVFSIISFLIIVNCKKEVVKDSNDPLTVIATVNNVKITVGDFRQEIMNAPPGGQGLENRRKLLNSILEKELILAEGLKIGLDKEPDIIAEIEHIEKEAGLQELFDTVVFKDIVVTEDEMKKFYENLKEEVKAREILVPTLQEADSILKVLKSGGNFEKIAKEKSISNTAESGGDMGFIKWGLLIDELEKPIFSMKVGEISQPIKTDFGYHIIKVEERRKNASLKSYDKEKSEISNTIADFKRSDALQKFMSSLRASANPIIDEKLLDSIDPEETKVPPANTILATTSTGDTFFVKDYLKEYYAREKDGFHHPHSLEAKKEALLSVIDKTLMEKEVYKRGLNKSERVKMVVHSTMRQLIPTRFFEKEIMGKITVSEQEINDYYNSNKDKYMTPEERKIRWIVVSDENSAKKIADELKTGGNFGKIAKEKSIDPSSKNDGIIGYLSKYEVNERYAGTNMRLVKTESGYKFTKIDSIVVSTAFSMEINKPSEPIKISDGYAIIQVDDIIPSRPKNLESVKDEIKQNLATEKANKKMQELIANLKSKAKIKIEEKVLQEFCLAELKAQSDKR